jgi:hypothetical protein
MPDENLSGEDERRLLELFEQSSLTDYPNPDRIGCPGQDFLRQLAFHRTSIPVGDERLNHITQCSPCFGEFVNFREEARRRIPSTRMLAFAAVLLLAIGLSVYFALRPHTGIPSPGSTEPYQAAKLDLKNFVLPRGPQPSDPATSVEAVELRRRRLSLTITLPLASPPGSYELQILREVDRPLATAAGQARMENGLTLLVVKLDLSSFEPGKYLVGIRRASRDWTYYPIAII